MSRYFQQWRTLHQPVVLLQQEDVVPFDCQCGGEGRFLVTYIPRSPGTYFISVKSHDAHIEGSPFEVKVGPSF